MEKKFKLTSNKKVWCGITLFQIEAVVSFGTITKGELGGYIEKEENLSQVSGDAWVSGDAQVSGDAWVSGNAQVFGNAWVYGNARVYGNAWVYGNARVYGNAQVFGDAWVFGNAWVYGNAWVSGNARVSGDAQVSGNAWVYGDAQVSGNAWVYGKFKLTLGYFFGYRYKKEEIKYQKIDDDYEIIYKGVAKIEAYEDETEKNIRG